MKITILFKLLTNNSKYVCYLLWKPSAHIILSNNLKLIMVCDNITVVLLVDINVHILSCYNNYTHLVTNDQSNPFSSVLIIHA